MFRSILLKCSPPIRMVTRELSAPQPPRVLGQGSYRRLSTSYVFCKKRKSVEERAIENQSKRIVRYSPKAAEVVGIWRDMTVRDLAAVLHRDVDHILKALDFADKSGAQYKATSVLRSEQVVRDVVKICGCRYRLVPKPGEEKQDEEDRDATPSPPAPQSEQVPRPPVVCVMGHVDHGKTTLLDALRGSRLVDLEHGGITQHIGAFEVSLPGGPITFLDTPGHAAFAAMRARGARGADLVVLVVAADDGVMPMTRESVDMAREAGVPIVVAVNKIDKPEADFERTLRQLASEGVVCEPLGGEVQAVGVSARSKRGLGALLEAVGAQAALLGLTADPGGLVHGVVLDARLDKQMGKQATVLVQRGTLKKGTILVAGLGWAKVRSIKGAVGGAVAGVVTPGAAGAVAGWRALPQAGDMVLEVTSEHRALSVVRHRSAAAVRARAEGAAAEAEARAQPAREQYRAALAARRRLGRVRTRQEGPREKMLQEDDFPTLNVIVKGDVDGSVEAILDVLATYDDPRVRLNVIHSGVGAVSRGDADLAAAARAHVLAFNVPVHEDVDVHKCTVHHHTVIYKLVEQVQDLLSERLPPQEVEEVLGEASILEQFSISVGRGKAWVAGARAGRGALPRAARYRVARGGRTVYEGTLASMKHLKEEVNEIKSGVECGLRFADTEFEPRPGDTVTAIKTVTLPNRTSWDPGF